MIDKSKVFETYGLLCARCHTSINLTRHHLKSKTGKMTGYIQILCRNCHDIAEAEYKELGIDKIRYTGRKRKRRIMKKHHSCRV